MFALSIIVSFIMLIVAFSHFYWAFGGKHGLMSAGPRLEGDKDFIPSSTLIFVVAVMLLGLSVLAIQLVSPLELLKNYIHYIGYLVSAIFIIRAIGDFKYIGFFKKVYNSNFAKLDTKYFSPLALLLGISYGVLSRYGT
ncbi:DUF3995 domain-containing protein [Paraglaciecola sp.]|uniref:DUF3995 domain-containing protein n=1 Tax=Paraglaciecola sp. TaxID=1920173 RepID=UPI003EF8C7E7